MKTPQEIMITDIILYELLENRYNRQLLDFELADILQKKITTAIKCWKGMTNEN